ncbi:MAG: serine/threonine-protein kinase [Acidobacteriota bacterium]
MDDSTRSPVHAADGTPRASPAADASFAPGARLAGRYRIVRFLAAGSVGEVYEAIDEDLSETVALKILRDHAADDARVHRRFRREILLARRVTHRNVCRIFDVGELPQPSDALPTRFFTMELLRGVNLAERMAQTGPMPFDVALALARQMADGLDAAHRVGVVHRDFKPANVMLVERGSSDAATPRVVIADFGLARRDDSLSNATLQSAVTLDGMVVGTPAYMAPEQVRGDSLGPAADQYAFGIVLYEMVTGHVPFEGGQAVDVATRRLSEAPMSPRRWRRDLPAHWERAILRCLAREADERFPSMTDAVRALDAPARSAPLRDRPGVRIGLALLAALLLVGVGWWLGRATAPSAAAGAMPQTASTGMAAPSTAASALQLGSFDDRSGEDGLGWVATLLRTRLRQQLGELGYVIVDGRADAATLRGHYARADGTDQLEITLELVEPAGPDAPSTSREIRFRTPAEDLIAQVATAVEFLVDAAPR